MAEMIRFDFAGGSAIELGREALLRERGRLEAEAPGLIGLLPFVDPGKIGQQERAEQINLINRQLEVLERIEANQRIAPTSTQTEND